MADAPITLVSPSDQNPVVLVTDDDALACLVKLEATELGLPLEHITAIERELREGSAVLLDLDSQGGMQAALRGLVDRFIGICRQANALPTLLGTRALHLLERPFATTELRALLGQLRDGVLSSTVPLAVSPSTLHAMSITLEDDTTVRCGDVSVHLTPKEATLLRCLLEERGQTVARERLQASLDPTGKSERGNEVEVYLCYLRRKLEKPIGRRLITTVRGVGYRLEWGEQ
ncbi:MAG: helix-turn-helix domain-containing protein [Clostridia bacterium]|nr:helix-turn-helix domain-containing protein [Clostridia bacterium]